MGKRLKKSATKSLCPSATKFLSKSANKSPKRSATTLNTTFPPRKNTGSAKKSTSLTQLNTKQNTTNNATKSKSPSASPNTRRNVLTSRSNTVKLLTRRNVLTSRSNNVRPSTKPNTQRNRNATPPTPKNANLATTTRRNVNKSQLNLANTLMFPIKFPISNALTSMFPKRCLNKNAAPSLFLTAKMFQSNIATRNIRKSATKFPFMFPSRKSISPVTGQNTDITMTQSTANNLLNISTMYNDIYNVTIKNSEMNVHEKLGTISFLRVRLEPVSILGH